jgi:predicted membrane protein
MYEMNKNTIISIVSVIFLLLAVFGSWPYDFFTILRFVVAGGAAYLCYRAYQGKEEHKMVVFGAVTILFNPFLPIYLSRSIWQVIDLATAGIFLYFTYRKNETL